jgi:hypothetical protein
MLILLFGEHNQHRRSWFPVIKQSLNMRRVLSVLDAQHCARYSGAFGVDGVANGM